jgi:NCAIR mutase (PurE)-related protein
MSVANGGGADAAGSFTNEQDSEVDEVTLRELLDRVRQGSLSADDAVDQLRRLPIADLGYARIDHHRALRQGMAETVYGPGKTPAQCAAIVAELLAQPGRSPVMLTRADSEQCEAALRASPDGELTAVGDRAIVTWRAAAERHEAVVVVTAGTADLPVADECDATLRAHGFRPLRISDVGVAGLHRVLDTEAELAAAQAVVVVAGMEGALASVVGGLTAAPVVAVPTSVGYGASLDGVTALLAMLASCASGISVVGIDNGFGAACAVVRLLRIPATDEVDSGV